MTSDIKRDAVTADEFLYELMALIVELEVFADLLPDGEHCESLHALVAGFTELAEAIAREIAFLETELAMEAW